ncbi:MAG: hypothetical protein ACHQET_00325 [Chitinophagales bacterium]
MKGIVKPVDFRAVVFIFVVSRIILFLLGLRMNILPLFQYWQYLDVETLKHNLLRGVWYDHAQPPMFNIFLGVIIKVFGASSLAVFDILFKAISLANAFFLHRITKLLVKNPHLPALVAICYILSPATMVIECDLSYTICVSLLLLLSLYFLLRFYDSASWLNSIGIFLPLCLLCLTRSMYHLLWFLVVSGIILGCYGVRKSYKRLLVSAGLSLLTVISMYVKNYLIFGIFYTSSWLGMNLSRNVFHEQEITDSSNIMAIGPFEQISKYRHFYNPEEEKKYAGLNDRDLLKEYKNDSFINLNHVGYIDVSKQFMEASKKEILAHPVMYLYNVSQSFIAFFSPATRYVEVVEPVKIIKYYDILYSFNLLPLGAENRQKARTLIVISAIPKVLLYIAVISLILKSFIRNRKWTVLNMVIMFCIGYVFVLSSLVEHYENMRFRFEVEPLFLILAVQAVSELLEKSRVGRKSKAPRFISAQERNS